MTFKQLKARLSDPIILGGLILMILGEVQAQSDVLLDWLSPTAAGRVLSLIGIIGMVVRWVQALPDKPTQPDDNQQAGFARPLMLAFMLAISLPAAFSLHGCATLGLAPASTFDQRLAYAVTQNAAVRQAAANALEAGEIQSSDATRVLQITDQVRTALDGAKLASGTGDISTAEGRLQLATALLVELQKYLRKPS